MAANHGRCEPRQIVLLPDGHLAHFISDTVGALFAQRFGSALNAHIHLHCCVTDGELSLDPR